MENISNYPEMQEWLERDKNDVVPSDMEVWGVQKLEYTFKDLELWKVHRTLQDPGAKKLKKLDKSKVKMRNNEQVAKHKKGDSDDGDNSLKKEKGEEKEKGKEKEEMSSSKAKSKSSSSKSHKCK